MKTITVVSDDKVGLLADISYVLAKSKVNIDSLNAELIGRKAIITLLVKDPDRARTVLGRSGYRITEAESIVVRVSNKMGEIEKIGERLSHAGVNIEHVNMLSSTPSEGIFVFKVDKPRKASNILADCIVNID